MIHTLVEPSFLFCLSDINSKILEDDAFLVQVFWKTLEEMSDLSRNVWILELTWKKIPDLGSNLVKTESETIQLEGYYSITRTNIHFFIVLYIRLHLLYSKTQR